MTKHTKAHQNVSRWLFNVMDVLWHLTYKYQQMFDTSFKSIMNLFRTVEPHDTPDSLLFHLVILGVLKYVVLMWKYGFKLMKVVLMCTLVTFWWCLRVGTVMGNYLYIAPTITRGFLGGKRLRVKRKIMISNDNLALHELYGFMWCCE